MLADMRAVTTSPRFRAVIARRLKQQAGAKMVVVDSHGGLRLLPLRSAAEWRGMARGIDTGLQRDPGRPL